MNRETIINELRQLEKEMSQDLSSVQSAIRILEKSIPETPQPRPRLQEKPCMQCGLMFKPSHNRSMLCSEQCRAGQTAKKKRELKQKTSTRRLRQEQPMPHPWNEKPKQLTQND